MRVGTGLREIMNDAEEASCPATVANDYESRRDKGSIIRVQGELEPERKVQLTAVEVLKHSATA